MTKKFINNLYSNRKMLLFLSRECKNKKVSLFPVKSNIIYKFDQNGRQQGVRGKTCYVLKMRGLIVLFKEMAHDCKEAKSPNVSDMLNQSRNELTAIRDKRKELDAIQADLDDLIERLNVFIGKSETKRR